MDPKANIHRQREIARQLVAWFTSGEDDTPADYLAIAELAELVLALDEWRSKGGFDPYDQLQQVHVALWTDDGGEPQAQVYRTLEGATRDFHDSYPNVTIAASTVQP